MDESRHFPANRATQIALQLAQALEPAEFDYAIGGAIALGIWSEPRGTVDVDVTIFASADEPSACLELLREAGVEFLESEARESIKELGFFSGTLSGVRVGVFLPTIPVYESCRNRRAQVKLLGHRVYVWRPEAVAIFKIMFFRQKDLIDVELMLQVSSAPVDCD